MHERRVEGATSAGQARRRRFHPPHSMPTKQMVIYGGVIRPPESV